MSRHLKGGVFAIFLAATVAAAVPPWPSRAPAFAAAEYQKTPPRDAPAVFRRGFVTASPPTAVVHAGTLAELEDGTLLAAWFGGSREGAPDVAIYGARLAPGAEAWGPPEVLATREGTQRDLARGVRKLGNPVLHRDPAGRLWLLYVAVSLGGWAGSSVVCRHSDDGGLTWSAARPLVTSPLLNISTLVRARPLDYRDGGLLVPAYHELGAKFGLGLGLAPDGGITGRHPMGHGRTAFQPWVVATGPREAVALLRRTGDGRRRVYLTRTGDAGRTWSAPEPTVAPNPDAAVTAALGPGGRGLVAVLNDQETNRNRLAVGRLALDGSDWRPRSVLEEGAPEDEYSYPYLLRGRDGTYHLVYTWRRERIAYVRFDAAWLEAAP